MSVTRIAGSLPGEQVVGIWPTMAPFVDAGWRRRIRLHTGLALSDSLLRAEQEARAGRIVTLAQALSPGVVNGLEVSVDPMLGLGSAGPFFVEVAPGVGLLRNGEDVRVPRAVRVSLSDLLPPDFSTTVAAMRAAVLVLEPVELLELGRTDPDDPCEIDETEAAFSDEQRVDGVLLRLLPWQDEWSGGPLTALGAARNPLAYSIFERERQFLPGDLHPWEAIGVPLGLIGFEAGVPTYLDRYAVVRAGGRARRRTPLCRAVDQRAGTPFLWDARIQQLATQLLDLTLEGVAVGLQAARLAFLPPAGLLPVAAADVRAHTNAFFPASYRVRMAPVPLEQLDALLGRCAGLAPLATVGVEAVLVLVPVPQAVYEPHLLTDELVSGEFADAVTRFRGERDDARARREYLRELHTAITVVIDSAAKAPVYSDEGALEDEPVVIASGTGEDDFDVVSDSSATPPVLRPQAFLDLRAQVQAATFLVAAEKDELTSLGLVAFIEKLRHKIDLADDGVDFAFLKAHTDIYRVRQVMLGSTVASRLASSPALATIVQAESAVAQREEVNRFYLGLKGKLPFGGLELSTAAAPVSHALAPTGSGGGGGQPVALAFNSGVLSLGAGGLTAAPSHPALGLDASAGSTHSELFVSGASGGLQSSLGLGALNIEVLAGKEAAYIPAAPGRTKVQDDAPVAGGGGYDFRTASIAKRLDAPPASEARTYTVATRFEAVALMDRLSSAEVGLHLDDISVPGIPKGTFDERGFPLREAVPLSTLRARGLGTLLDDPPPHDPLDESSHFLESVRILEHNIATLRLIEGRIANYKRLLDSCQRALDVLRGRLNEVSARLHTLDDQVGEGRHEVATALALLADETKRVDGINDRRHAVIAEHVRFLAYLRPRTIEALLDAPTIPLDPGLVEPVVPACLAEHADPPPELESMVHLLREAPLAWFRHVPAVLEKLDRVELLQGTLVSAQLRAQTVLAQPVGAPGGLLTFVNRSAATPLGKSIDRITQAQHARIIDHRVAVTRLDLARFVGLGWRETREQAVQSLSLGDLIDANHGRRAVAQAAADELDHISRIAGCLYTEVGDVVPAIRLAWADRLSQYEDSAPLGSLAALPRWGEIPFADRKQIQELGDWLYGRIDTADAEALAWMHDLVRVCILLASHAPVDDIIAGHLLADATAAPGVQVSVTIDPARVKLGMRVMFYRGQEMVAHGLVEDLQGGLARTRVLETAAASVPLQANGKARFVAKDDRFTVGAFTFRGR